MNSNPAALPDGPDGEGAGRGPPRQGYSALVLAAEQGHAEVMRALIGAKADQTATTVQSGGSTTAVELLLLAASTKQGNVAHMLAVSGADVNVRNKVRRREAGRVGSGGGSVRCGGWGDGRSRLWKPGFSSLLVNTGLGQASSLRRLAGLWAREQADELTRDSVIRKQLRK